MLHFLVFTLHNTLKFVLWISLRLVDLLFSFFGWVLGALDGGGVWIPFPSLKEHPSEHGFVLGKECLGVVS